MVARTADMVGEAHMDDAKAQQAALARLVSAIERAAGDLSLEEEPARFVAALDDAAEAASDGSGPGVRETS
jgi:hypothetical protein